MHHHSLPQDVAKADYFHFVIQTPFIPNDKVLVTAAPQQEKNEEG